jgi:hypothetical protein
MRCHRTESSVDLGLSSGHHGCCPFHDVIAENTIVKFMQDVWCHASKDVAVRKIGPERIDWTQALLDEVHGIFAVNLISQNSQSFGRASPGRMSGVAAAFRRTSAPEAGILATAAHEALLGIIGDVRGENEVHLSHKPISTIHLHSILSSHPQRPEHYSHTVMEELVAHP